MVDKIKIEVRELSKSFSNNKVLRSLNLKIPSGKITAIIGRSGEGKSVLFKHIIGLMNPDSGDVYIDDLKISDLNGKDLNKIRAKLQKTSESWIACIFFVMNFNSMRNNLIDFFVNNFSWQPKYWNSLIEHATGCIMSFKNLYCMTASCQLSCCS